MPVSLTERADRLNLRAGFVGRLPPVILVTDEQRMPDPLAAMAGLRAGDAVLLRHYRAPDRRDLAYALAAACRAARLRLIVGGDVALAQTVGAHGVHFPERLAARAGSARHARRGFLVTAAAHSWRALVAAHRHGADAVLLSPVFATASHPGATGIGACRFAALAHRSPVPVYALGGITATTAGRLAATGAVGIAAIGAFTA
ncbi:MAG: thiamine phosphate synthase [Proteobacteria bacterium]|nr:thiamine phosphate synthase [Pseudomonadota bacterium]MDA1057867.1 thiamine phosphate synthase [Pseudomonadota bacterium]